MLNLNQQIHFFTWSIIGGTFLALTYDMLRIHRRIAKIKDFLVVTEDILYIIFCSIVIFLIAYFKNNSELRFYEFLGIAIGFISFKIIAKDNLIKFLIIIISYILNTIKKLIKIILFPVKLIINLLKKPKRKIENCLKKTKKTIKNKLDIKKKVIINYLKCNLKNAKKNK